jgi:hypothetical protein
MTRPPRVVHLDELEAIPGPGSLTWHPVRAQLGIRAFGTNAFSAQRAGDDVVEPHEENPDPAHEDALERQPDAEDYVREVPELAALL